MLVSHQLDRIAELCTDVIVLTRGEVIARGLPSEAIAAYVTRSDDRSRPADLVRRIAFHTLHIEGEDVVRSGRPFTVRIAGASTETFDDTVEPLVIRVRSLKTGSMLFVSGSRRLGADLSQPGPFDVTLTLQANLPAGSYMVEAGAQSLLTHRDFATAPSAMIRVTDPGTFRGSVQLNASMQVTRG